MHTLKKLISMSVLLLNSTALVSFADDFAEQDKSYYGQFNAGGSYAEDPDKDFPSGSFDGSGVYGLAVGAEIANNYRIELGVDYRSNISADYNTYSIDDGVLYTENSKFKVKSLSVMARAFYDLHVFESGVVPYGFIGLGVADNKTNNYKISLSDSYTKTTTGTSVYSKGSETNFAWSIGVGAKYSLNDDFDINLQYQYVDLGKFKTGSSSSVNSGSYESTRSLKGKLRSQEVSVGIAYKF